VGEGSEGCRPRLAVPLDDEHRRAITALRIGPVADEPERAVSLKAVEQPRPGKLDRRDAGDAVLRELHDRDVVREAVAVEAPGA